MTATQQALFDLIVVHCFTCPHTVEHSDPAAAHDLMEQHYDTEHAVYISAIAAGMTP